MMAFDHDSRSIARRYDKLAHVYGAVCASFLLRPRLRREAVRRLDLPSGGTVLEVGCGTGSNLKHLLRQVGPGGHVIGIDVSPGMLARARRLCDRRGWGNVSLVEQDFGGPSAHKPVDAVLFSLTYSVLPEQRSALSKAWDLLAQDGTLVIMDAGLPEGWMGRLLRPTTVALSRATVLGNPDSRPWEDLAALGADVEVDRFQLGTYYICRARKDT